ncbi:MAG: DNA translocase FtsK [Bacteroidales bacterium]|nr:DNA translocase FtsK [Bacteroidales bacterium]
MKIECPKCGHITQQSEEELAMLDYTITCPSCMSMLKIVDGIAYIPNDKAPLEQLKPLSQQPPEFKGIEYYEHQAALEGLDPLYSAAVDYIKTCNAITLPMLQRYFNIPPERAEQLMQQLEDNKVVAPFDGLHPRKILIPHNTGLPGVFSHTRQYDPEAQEAAQRLEAEGSDPTSSPRSRSCTCSLPGCGIILFVLLLAYILAQLLR